MLWVLLALLSSIKASGASLAGQVWDIEGGASFEIVTGSGEHRRVLLSGIVAPKQGTQHSRDARKQLHMLLAGRFVRVEYDELTPSAEIVGRVFHGGRDINQRMLESGLGRLNPEARLETDLLRRYLAAQQQARRLGLGIWRR